MAEKQTLITLGNGQFIKEEIAKMTFSKFEKTFKGKLKGISLKDAYKKCGGKVKSSS